MHCGRGTKRDQLTACTLDRISSAHVTANLLVVLLECSAYKAHARKPFRSSGMPRVRMTLERKVCWAK